MVARRWYCCAPADVAAMKTTAKTVEKRYIDLAPGGNGAFGRPQPGEREPARYWPWEKPGDRPEFPAKCAGNYVSVPNGAPTERRASSTPSAVVRQENCAARSGPAAASRWRRSVSVTRRCMTSAMAEGSHGSNLRAAVPAMPFMGSMAEQPVGTPAARASRTGSPKPSNRLG